MWCHLPTGFSRRVLLRFVVISSLFIALFTTLFFVHSATAAEGINKTLNFQGRLLNSSGGVVPDGYYNIQFKLYEGGAGTAANNPGGTLKWTENYINNGGTGGIRVKNGLMSVNLGSVTPFGTSVDWNQDTIWLSMNIAGSAAGCTAFGSGPCVADGEMVPMKRLTSSPYAMNAGAVGGKTADNFVQLAQGVQEDTSDNTSSIHINKTGTGNLIQLQNTGEDVFTVTNTGDIELGSGDDRSISIGDAATDTAGDNLVMSAGGGGAGAGSTGGGLILQGGDAGGANGDGGVVAIESGDGTGTGSDGSIYVGSSNTAGIQIGNTDISEGEQTIVIGSNTNSGGISNVVIGSTETSGGGTTRIQSKDETTIATDGVDRATFDTEGNLTLGNGISSDAPSDFRIQGTASSASGVSGGDLTVQGGNATAGNANGGNLTLSGGNGSGTGSKGLVVIDTPAYTSAAVQSSSANVNVTQSNIDAFGVVTLNATTPDINFTLGAPSLGAGAAGRVIYVTAANGSENFILRANTGAGNNVEQMLSMRQNTTTTMIWNGTLWTAAGGSGSMTLQDAYDNSHNMTGSAEILSYNNGLTVKNFNNDDINSTVLDVQGADAGRIFSVNSGTKEYSRNGGAEAQGASSSTFPTDTWGVAGTSTVDRYTTKGDYIKSGNASVRISSATAYSGAYNLMSEPLAPSTTYSVSMSVKLESGTFNNFGILYVYDGVNVSATCQDNITISTTEWTQIDCTFDTPASGITADNTIAFGQLSGGTYTYYVDNLSVSEGDTVNGGGSTSANVQIGDGTDDGPATLFTLDKANSAPIAVNSEALLGSMYYDTSLGKVQCYEADGWGTCGASPDNIVTMTPEYANAVMHGTGIGAMTADFCSDALNINDGSGAQATICAPGETRNLYKWTSPQSTTQEYGIYVTYKLPETFKSFATGSTSLQAATDSADSSVSYQVYRSNASGLTACGSAVATSTGAQTAWQTGTANGSSDPANCAFSAGDSLVIKILVSSSNSANAYVGDLGFTFDNL